MNLEEYLVKLMRRLLQNASIRPWLGTFFKLRFDYVFLSLSQLHRGQQSPRSSIDRQ